MELTVPNVFGLLLRSKLLAADDAKTMYARWQAEAKDCLLYTSPSPRDRQKSRMPSSA